MEIELRQAQEMTNIYSDILTGTMDASVISNNMNIMKQMTSISIILMIPTVIVSME
jgi:magnesium transporter